ncbi:MAG: dienelactone hydrolase family protein [Acidobacteriota bacterium]
MTQTEDLRSLSAEDLQRHDDLADFAPEEHTYLGRTKTVFRAGTGPAVIVMTEMPGITYFVARFARRVRDAGFTVFLPQMFGTPGRPMSTPYMLGSLSRACISREFRAFSSNRSSPITAWLRALAAAVHPDCGGEGVGAIGMCFTGNFALSLMLEPAVKAPVLSQPSLPLGRAGGMHIAPDELAEVKERLEREDLVVLGYRFQNDKLCRAERFAAYREALGDRFRGRELPDEAGATGAPIDPHSVVTVHLVDEEGEPTREAVDEILDFFRERLESA